MNKVWSDAEKQYIRENANTMKDQELADKLSNLTGRKISLQSVRKQRQKMKIAKRPGRGICGTVKDNPVQKKKEE